MLGILFWILTPMLLLLTVSDVRQVFLPKLIAERRFQHLTFATIFILYLLWITKAGIKSDLDLHFLGLTALSLMYGWRVALLVGFIVSSLLVLFQQLPVTQLAHFFIISVALPIGISYFTFAKSYQYLPRNIFVFIFVAGFFNATLTASLHLIVNASTQLLMNHHTLDTIIDHYLIFIPLMALPEGLLNGMALAMMAVFKPEWLRVFSDRAYLYPNQNDDS